MTRVTGHERDDRATGTAHLHLAKGKAALHQGRRLQVLQVRADIPTEEP